MKHNKCPPSKTKKNNALVLVIIAIVAVATIVFGIFVIAPSKLPEVSGVNTDEAPKTDIASKKLTEIEVRLTNDRICKYQ